MENLHKKLKALNDFLEEKHHLSLGDVFSIDEEEEQKILSGKKTPDDDLIKSIEDLFYLENGTLKDDEKELPHADILQVDEALLSAKQDEYRKNVGKRKDKEIIKRNYKALDKKSKTRLWINLGITGIPFIAFILFSFIRIIANEVNTINTYKEGDSLSASQQKIADSLPTKENSELEYVDVKVGSKLESIREISSQNSSYSVTMSVQFDFDQIEFHKMWWLKEKSESFNADGFYTDEDLLIDNYCFDSDSQSWLKYSDNIPDVIQFNFEDSDGNPKHLKASDGTFEEPTSISSLYTDEIAHYPGEKSSNVYADKNDEFSIGNGKITPDTLEYFERGQAYKDDSGNYRFYQRLHFTATINKAFDSPRYPLDSAQFHIYIQPNRNSDYIRYVADEDMSGFSDYFSMSDSYRLIKERKGIKNLTVKLNYYKDKDVDPSSSTFKSDIYKTQFEVIVRANKVGMSVFFNSFLNIIAVSIWLILAFFNQSFNKDDSISMIGTGFFSAISAILLGFSLSSGSNLFSLLSLVNIFTLAMVLVMGYESISARRCLKLSDPQMVSYRTVRMRILFYFFVTCSALIYVVLPLISYMWIL